MKREYILDTAIHLYTVITCTVCTSSAGLGFHILTGRYQAPYLVLIQRGSSTVCDIIITKKGQHDMWAVEHNLTPMLSPAYTRKHTGIHGIEDIP